jgi:two-component system sensor histidine kinase DevS
VTISSDLELQVVLLRVVEAAVELVDARYGALGVLDESREQLAEFITVGADAETRNDIGALPKGLGLLGSVIRDAQPHRLADLHEHPDSVGFPPHHPPMTSFLGVPIRVRNEVFGNLYLTDKTTGEVFTDVDEELALGLASAAAVAIDNARLFGQLRRREATLAAMGEIAAALLAGAVPAESLQLVASRARELLGADLATVALPQADKETMAIEIVDGPLGDELRGQLFSSAGSVSGEVLRHGVMVVVEDASKDARTGQPQVGTGRIGPAVWVPLVTDGQPFGILSIARAVGGVAFTASDLEVAASFATQASVILEHYRAHENLQRLDLLEDQERIARDLHDTVIQRLFGVSMTLEATLPAVVDPWVVERINLSVEDLDATIRRIRTVIFGLEELRPNRSPGLRSQALEITSDAARTLGFEPQVTFEGPIDTVVDDATARQLLATLREALSNVARHAAAQRVDITLAVAKAELLLSVQDDGRGLDPSHLATTTGNGLANMATRAERLGGEFRIEPGAAGGTRLTWRLPLRALG